MQDALDSIADLLEACEEYGSDINIISQTQSIPFGGVGYDYDNEENNKGSETTSVTFKALPSAFDFTSSANKNIAEFFPSSVGKKVINLKFYTTIAFNKSDNKIKYKNETYEIIFIKEKTLQNLVISYEVLVAN